MRTLFHVFLFLLSFTLEVTVHAAEVAPQETEAVLQEPRECLKTGDVCAVENLNEKGFTLKVGSATVVLDQGSSLIRKSKTEIRLVKGTAWIKGALSVSSEFGSATGTNEFWVTKTATEMTVMVSDGAATLNPRGSSESLTVDAGLQNTIGQIGFNGIAATGIPMPISFKDFVMRWGRLSRAPKLDFESAVGRFHDVWEQATRVSAAINRTLVQRRIAGVEDQARVEAEKKAKVEAEGDALRKWTRQRMLNGM